MEIVPSPSSIPLEPIDDISGFDDLMRGQLVPSSREQDGSHLLIEHWDGSDWSIVDLPDGENDTGGLVSRFPAPLRMMFGR